MRRLAFVVAAAWQGFWRNPAMSVASTLTVALMLVLATFFAITNRGLQQAVALLEQKVELVLYLEDSARPTEILALKSRIEADPAVQSVAFISKEQAIERLRQATERSRDLALGELDNNPLPASLEVKLARAQEAGRLASTLRREEGLGVVSEIVDNPAVVDNLLTITRVLSIGGIAVLVMMLLVTLFVIVNTIRIAVTARRDEIEIMRLVGASDRLIRWPFILEGMLVGAFGAVLALTAIGAGAPAVADALTQFAGIVPLDFSPVFLAQLGGAVFGFALLVGAAGAGWSVRAHLTA
ncbi:MAG: ABC transporter permease [Chloroflexi bacterium]|nr:ABC transporter permease [Chloroflexota bacterium]